MMLSHSFQSAKMSHRSVVRSLQNTFPRISKFLNASSTAAGIYKVSNIVVGFSSSSIVSGFSSTLDAADFSSSAWDSNISKVFWFVVISSRPPS